MELNHVDLAGEQAIVDAITAQAPAEAERRQRQFESERERALRHRDDTAGPALDLAKQQAYQAKCLASGDPPYFARVVGRFRDCEGKENDEDVRISSFPVKEEWPVGEAAIVISSIKSGIAELVRDPDRQHASAWGGRPASGEVQVIEARVEDVEICGGRVLRASPRYTSVFEDRVQQRLIQTGRNEISNMTDVLDREQGRILNRGPYPLLVIQGGAGTGKTVVALHYAATHAAPGEAGIYLTPTQTLADYLRPGLPALGFSHPAFDTASLEDFARNRMGVANLPRIGARRTRNENLRALKEDPSALWPRIQAAHAAVAGKSDQMYRTLLASLLQILRVTLPDADTRFARLEVVSGQERYRLSPERLLEGPIAEWPEAYTRQVAAVVRELVPMASANPVAAALVSQDALGKLQQSATEDPVAVYREALAAACREQSLSPDDSLAFEDLGGIIFAAALAGKGPGATDFLLLDEAHAFSLATFSALARIISSSTHVILCGDLNQRLTGDAAPWSKATEAFGRPNAPVLSLDQAYRIPQGLQRYAVQTLGEYAVAPPGSPSSLQSDETAPEVIPCRTPEESANTLTRLIIESEKQGLRQIVVLAPDADRAREVAHAIGERMVSGPRRAPRPVEVVDGTRPYTGKLAISWPEAFAGMEADVVILTDADEAHYPDTPEAARRLYAAFSRAKHRLVVLSLQSPSLEEQRCEEEQIQIKVRQRVIDKLRKEAASCIEKADALGGSAAMQARKGDLMGAASRMKALADKVADVDAGTIRRLLWQVAKLPQPRPFTADEIERLESAFLPHPYSPAYQASPLLPTLEGR